jgi:hypothetical protein
MNIEVFCEIIEIRVNFQARRKQIVGKIDENLRIWQEVIVKFEEKLEMNQHIQAESQEKVEEIH